MVRPGARRRDASTRASVRTGSGAPIGSIPLVQARAAAQADEASGGRREEAHRGGAAVLAARARAAVRERGGLDALAAGEGQNLHEFDYTPKQGRRQRIPEGRRVGGTRRCGRLRVAFARGDSSGGRGRTRECSQAAPHRYARAPVSHGGSRRRAPLLENAHATRRRAADVREVLARYIAAVRTECPARNVSRSTNLAIAFTPKTSRPCATRFLRWCPSCRNVE